VRLQLWRPGRPDRGVEGIAGVLGVRQLGAHAYTFGVPDITDATDMATYAYDKLHFRTTFILEDTLIEYTRRDATYFAEKFKSLGGTVLGQATFKNTDPSIASQISQIKSLPKPPDFIELSSLLPGGASAIRQIRAAGINLPIVSEEGMEGVFWQKAIPHLNDFYYSALAAVQGDDPRPEVNALVKRYTDQYGAPPQIGSAIMGYRAMYALKDAIEQAHSLNPTAVANALDTFDNKVLPPGVATTFTKDDHFTQYSPMVIVGVFNGVNKVEELATPAPGSEPPVLP
jgi:branched-chain amino acid transport system substrate-binding protein